MAVKLPISPFQSSLRLSGVVPAETLATVWRELEAEGFFLLAPASGGAGGSGPGGASSAGRLSAENRTESPSQALETDPVRQEDTRLADELVRREVLTRYQADQLLAGRTKLTLGPYIITDWIGEGGMGQVFKAVHNVMGRESAVKVLPQNKHTDQAKVIFRREIRAQARLDHPHLVRAYDAGEDGNVSYLVVEYVPGVNLRRLVRLQEKLSMAQAASVIMQAALGLAHAHSKGLIHRDVKPGNILVTPEGLAKVSDLGLAGYLGENEADPLHGKVMGTADYLSPEQIRGQPTGPASDIYALGCTLYYAVTGKVPFPTGSAASKAVRHCEGQPYHPRMFNPDLSEEFVDLIADMTEKSPEDRPASMEEVAERLSVWAESPVALAQQRLSRSPWIKGPVPTGEDDVSMLFFGDGGAAPSGSALGGSALGGSALSGGGSGRGGKRPVVDGSEGGRSAVAKSPDPHAGSSGSGVGGGSSQEFLAGPSALGPSLVPPPPPTDAVASAYEASLRKVTDSSRVMTVFMTLVVAVPLCLFLGTMLGFFLALLLR